jgi:hypothetical protein
MSAAAKYEGYIAEIERKGYRPTEWRGREVWRGFAATGEKVVLLSKRFGRVYHEWFFVDYDGPIKLRVLWP